MLVLRLLVMVLTIICLMDGHAEVSSSTTGIRDRRESPAVKTNEPEVQIHDRKKKKKPKPSKKKKPKPGKKKKPNKAKPTPTKPVTTTPTVSTSTLKTTTILTTPTITTTTATVSPTTTTTATTTLSTTTSATTTVATSSTASTTTTTIPTTATTSSLPTTAVTTADSGAGEECKATNGKPCIFPFKDGKEEYNECKNEGGKYFWCATSVYDSGKYKHWSYCPEDRSCPLEGDGECRAENNKPCVFPFKDGVKEYNECADHGGQYFWCATGTNSAGMYTAWSKCPKDGSCPLPQKSSTSVITPTATAAITTPLTTGTTMAPMEKKVFSSLKDLVKEESKNDTFKMLQTMNEEMQAINEDLEGQRNIESNHGSSRNATILKKHSVGDGQDGDLIELRSYGENSEFTWNTFTYKGPTYLMGESNCCSACKKKWSDTLFFEYWPYFKKCWCYKEGSYFEPGIKYHNSISTGKCGSCDSCSCSEEKLMQDFRTKGEQPSFRAHTYTSPFTDKNGAQVTYVDDWPKPIPLTLSPDKHWPSVKTSNEDARKELHKTFADAALPPLNPNLALDIVTDFKHVRHQWSVIGHCRIPDDPNAANNFISPGCLTFMQKYMLAFKEHADVRWHWFGQAMINLVAGDENPCTWNFLIQIYPGGPTAFISRHPIPHVPCKNKPDGYPHWHIRQAKINNVEYAIDDMVTNKLRAIFDQAFVQERNNQDIKHNAYDIALCPILIPHSANIKLQPNAKDDPKSFPTSFENFVELESQNSQGHGLKLGTSTAAGYAHYVYK